MYRDKKKYCSLLPIFRPRVLMVMELMEGGELFELVRTKRRFTEKQAVNFTKQVRLKLSIINYLKLTNCYSC